MSNDSEDIEAKEKEALGNDPWMETYTGKKFFLGHDLNLDQINIEDIAHSLALNCRYNGHCSRFYSVAEHSVLISKIVPEEYAKVGLLHDATEAYLSDIVRPFKRSLGNYVEIENTLYSRIAKKFGIEETIPGIVKFYDVALCRIEGEDLMTSKAVDWGIPEDGLTRNFFEERTGYSLIPGWDWQLAKINFLKRFHELFT